MDQNPDQSRLVIGASNYPLTTYISGEIEPAITDFSYGKPLSNLLTDFTTSTYFALEQELDEQESERQALMSETLNMILALNSIDTDLDMQISLLSHQHKVESRRAQPISKITLDNGKSTILWSIVEAYFDEVNINELLSKNLVPSIMPSAEKKGGYAAFSPTSERFFETKEGIRCPLYIPRQPFVSLMSTICSCLIKVDGPLTINQLLQDDAQKSDKYLQDAVSDSDYSSLPSEVKLKLELEFLELFDNRSQEEYIPNNSEIKTITEANVAKAEFRKAIFENISEIQANNNSVLRIKALQSSLG